MAARFPMAVVVTGSPLTVTIEGASAVVAAEDFVGSLATDDRVQAAFLGDRLTVLAKAGGGGGGGGTTEATAATANTLALRDANARIKAADGVAADDVATVGQISAGDTGWLDVTFESGYSSLGDSWPVQSRKKNGVVYLQGLVKRDAGNFAADTAYTTMFTLLTSCRPASNQYLAAGTTTSTTGAMVVVSSAGPVSVRNHTVALSWLALYGISFLED